MDRPARHRPCVSRTREHLFSEKAILCFTYRDARDQRSQPREGHEMKRREFLASLATPAFSFQGGARKKFAAISSTYHVRSHSDNFITRFLEGYWINDKYYPPPCDIVSLYMDQVHPADIGYRLASAYDFPVVKSIE